MELDVFARFHAAPGQEDRMARVMREQTQAVRLEPGCLFIQACRSKREPARFFLFSRWVDEPAFQDTWRLQLVLAIVVGLFAATVITILSELSFTLYSDVADIFNLLCIPPLTPTTTDNGVSPVSAVQGTQFTRRAFLNDKQIVAAVLSASSATGSALMALDTTTSRLTGTVTLANAANTAMRIIWKRGRASFAATRSSMVSRRPGRRSGSMLASLLSTAWARVAGSPLVRRTK